MLWLSNEVVAFETIKMRCGGGDGVEIRDEKSRQGTQLKRPVLRLGAAIGLRKPVLRDSKGYVNTQKLGASD